MAPRSRGGGSGRGRGRGRSVDSNSPLRRSSRTQVRQSNASSNALNAEAEEGNSPSSEAEASQESPQEQEDESHHNENTSGFKLGKRKAKAQNKTLRGPYRLAGSESESGENMDEESDVEEVERLKKKLRKAEDGRRRAEGELLRMYKDVHEKKQKSPAVTAPERFSTATKTSSSSTRISPSKGITTSPINPNSKLMENIKKSVKGMVWQPSASSDAVKISTFLRRFEQSVLSEGGNDGHMLKLIGLHLTGQAFEWYGVLPEGCPALSSWDEFKNRITKQYHPKLPFNLIHQRLKDCKKGQHESYTTHLLRFTNHVEDLEHNSLSHINLLNIYLDTLPADVAWEVNSIYRVQLEVSVGASAASDQNSPGLAEVCAWAAAIDQNLVQYRQRSSSQGTSTPKTPVTTPSTPSPLTTPPATFTPVPGVSPNYRGKNPKSNYQHPHSKPAASGGTSTGTPPISGGTGPAPPPVFPVLPPGGVKRESGLCFNCAQPGHRARHCPLPRNPDRPRSNEKTNDQ